jgi:hypothetical protein
MRIVSKNSVVSFAFSILAFFGTFGIPGNRAQSADLLAF